VSFGERAGDTNSDTRRNRGRWRIAHLPNTFQIRFAVTVSQSLSSGCSLNAFLAKRVVKNV
jgi:hypothetical protein